MEAARKPPWGRKLAAATKPGEAMASLGVSSKESLRRLSETETRKKLSTCLPRQGSHRPFLPTV